MIELKKTEQYKNADFDSIWNEADKQIRLGQ